MSQQRPISSDSPSRALPAGVSAGAGAPQPGSAPAADAHRGRSWRDRLRVGRLVTAGIGLVALWACGPVYIPVPPPDEISFSAQLITDSSGATRTMWITSGGPNANAIDATFFVTDLERGAGVIARARHDGSFITGPMEGSPGDRVSVFYRDSTGRDSLVGCVLLSNAPVADHCP